MKGLTFMNRLHSHCRPFCAILLVFTFCSGIAGADEIVVEGSRYRDVLVTKSSTTYYVQIPWEGRTISVRVEEVEESSVTISDDPYYRDKLKEEYRDARDLRASGELPPEVPKAADPRFQVQERSPSRDFEAFPGGPGGGAGAGQVVARTQLESMLAGMLGVQFRAGPGRDGMPSVVAPMPSGGTMELFGPPNRFMGLEIISKVPAAQVTMVTTQMQMFVAQSSPQAAAEFRKLVQEAQESGQSQGTIDGNSVKIVMKKSDEMIDLKMTFMALK